MPPNHERAPRERETLIFSHPEAAQKFSERVRERVHPQQSSAVQRKREIIAEEVAKEFEKEGLGVSNLHQPWEHTPAEHEEVQHLVNMAFQKDLSTTLRSARHSSHFPRNLDLLHDVLTNEMYELLKGSGVNKQAMGLWWLGIAGILGLGLFITVMLFVV